MAAHCASFQPFQELNISKPCETKRNNTRTCNRVAGAATGLPAEGLRSRENTRFGSRRTGVETLRGAGVESWSREADGRRRGLLIESLEDWRFSLDGAGRSEGAGTGSLESLGIPEGLASTGGAVVSIARCFAEK